MGKSNENPASFNNGFFIPGCSAEQFVDLLLDKLESRLNSTDKKDAGIIEVIGREELCKRLNIGPVTAIAWEKKGKIPCFRIGTAVRYNWQKVIESLESKKARK